GSACPAPLPRRGLPVARLRSSGGPCAISPEDRLARDKRGRGHHAGAGVLLRTVRCWARRDAGRRAPGPPGPRAPGRGTGDPVVTRVFVPRDAAALALGADGVASALASHATVVRTGSRGLFWLEPMIEVETIAGRVAYGPVSASDAPGLLDAG